MGGTMFKAIHNLKKNRKGFTLIELLIVVAIIGILAAIAIPQFSAYRRRGYNAAADSDLRNIRTTEEAMFSDFQDYGSAASTIGATATFLLTGGLTSTVASTVSLSPKVFAVARTPNAALGGINNTNALMKTMNSAGDQVYGSETDFTDLWRHSCGTPGNCIDGDLTTGPDLSDATQQFTSGSVWTKM